MLTLLAVGRTPEAPQECSRAVLVRDHLFLSLVLQGSRPPFAGQPQSRKLCSLLMGAIPAIGLWKVRQKEMRVRALVEDEAACRVVTHREEPLHVSHVHKKI